MLDAGTVRTAAIALEAWSEPDAPRSVKLYDSYIAAAEVLVESLLLHDHVVLPRLHERSYQDRLNGVLKLFGDDVVLEPGLSEHDTQRAVTMASEEFRSWPLFEQHARKAFESFAGIGEPVEYWDWWAHAKYQRVGFSAYAKYSAKSYDFSVTEFPDHPDQSASALLESMASTGGRGSSTGDLRVLWLTYRTFVYDHIGWLLNVPYSPHPQRAALWKAVNLRRSQPALFSSLVVDALADARIAVANDLAQLSGVSFYDVSIPQFFSYILTEAGKLSNVPAVLAQLRQTPAVRSLRMVLGELTRAVADQRSVQEVQRLLRDLKTINLDIQPPHAPCSNVPIQLGSALVPLGSAMLTRLANHLVAFIERGQEHKRPHVAFLRDVFRTTRDIWSFRDLYDRVRQLNSSPLRHTISAPREGHPSSFPQIGEHVDEDYVVVDTGRDDNRQIPPRQFQRDFAALIADGAKSFILSVVDIDNIDRLNARGSRSRVTRLLSNVGHSMFRAGAVMVSRTGGDTFLLAGEGHAIDEWEKGIRRVVETGGEGTRTTGDAVSISIGSASTFHDAGAADDLFFLAFKRMCVEKAMKKKGAAMMRVGVVVPLVEEFSVLQAHLEIVGTQIADGTHYYVMTADGLDVEVVATCLSDMGPVAAGQRVEKMIRDIGVGAVLLLGIAGSLDVSVSIGDVVVAEEICQFMHSAKAVPSADGFAFKYSGAHWKLSYAIKQAVCSFEFSAPYLFGAWRNDLTKSRADLPAAGAVLLSTNEPAIHVGHVASGDVVSGSAAFVADLRTVDRKLLAIEMEGAGAAMSAHARATSIPLVVIRGVSDRSDESKSVLQAEVNGAIRRHAMSGAVTLALQLLRWPVFCDALHSR